MYRAARTLDELTIDQPPAAPEASGMLSDAAGCGMLSGAGCWLANPRFASESASLAVPGFLPGRASSPEGRSGIPATPGEPAVGLLLEGSPCPLGENSAPGGSGTPGGRFFVPARLPKVFASGAASSTEFAVGADGAAARLNMARRTPHEQSAKAAMARGLKKAAVECSAVGRRGDLWRDK